jgi:hypothetical protein
MKINLNKEWSFIQNEIASSSNKGRGCKGRMLFEFQILLSALFYSEKQEEKLMLSYIYQKQKAQYLKI